MTKIINALLLVLLLPISNVSLCYKGKGLSTCIALLTWEDSWTAALYNLGSSSWLAWASGTVVHYATFHCPQLNPRCSTTDIQPPKSATLRNYPVVQRLLLINRPCRDGTLSWRWYTAAAGEIWTCDLTITMHIQSKYYASRCRRTEITRYIPPSHIVFSEVLIKSHKLFISRP